MHGYCGSQLNIIKQCFPKLYNLIREEASIQGINFEIAEDLDEALCWVDSSQGDEFWWTLNYEIDYYEGMTIEDEKVTDVITRYCQFNYKSYFEGNTNTVFVNKYNMAYCTKTHLEATSEGLSVDFTKKKRLADY